MKFGIIGAGAMGCLLGSFLARSREEVWLVDIWKEHIAAIRRSGLTVVSDGSSLTIPIHATTDPGEVGVCDVVIISTKFHHTRAAVQNGLSMIGDETVVMTVQNGIGNVERISEFVGPKQILFGLTTLGSVMKGPGKIEATFSHKADTYLWSLAGEPGEKVREVIRSFNKGGLNVQLSPDVRARIWRKLCLNASLSMPLAIPRLTCGDFIGQAPSLELIRKLVEEIVAVANREGVGLQASEGYEYVVNLAREAPDHMTSALVDVLNRRKTEIDSLNGAIVEKAKQHGIEVPYNTAITHLIRIIESTYDRAKENVR